MISAKEIKKRYESLVTGRVMYDGLWDNLAFFYQPRKQKFVTTRIPGQELPTDLYTSVGRSSSQIFAAGLQAYLSSPSQKWFSFRFKDDELQGNEDASAWLREGEDRVYDLLNNSNFSYQLYETYRALGIYGTGCLYEEEDPDDIVRFYDRNVREIYVVEDAKQEVKEVYRACEFEAQQAVDFFGENDVSSAVRNKAQKRPYEKILFIHYVFYREGKVKADKYSKPVGSIWIEYDTVKLVKEGGYNEFPFFVARFGKNSDEVYGYSPGMNVLPEIRMVNRMWKTLLMKGEKAVAPPLDAPAEGYVLPLDLSADAVNYHDRGLGEADLIRPLLPDVGRALTFTEDLIEKVEDKVKQAFFVDLFLLLTSQPKMTATEVMQRVNEKMMILSPFLGRVMHSLLQPLLIRTFNIALRNGLISEPPDILNGRTYTIEYISPLAKAQKSYEARSLQNFLGVVQELAGMTPEALDKVNIDEIIKEYAEIENVNPKILRDDAEVEQIRANRIQAQQQAQQLEAVGKMVGSGQGQGY